MNGIFSRIVVWLPSCFQAEASTELSAASNDDKTARRRYFFFGAVVAIVLQATFAVSQAVTAPNIEMWFDAAAAGLLIGVLIILCRFRWERAAYRLGIATVIFICSYTAILPNYELDAALFCFFVVPMASFYVLGIREALRWMVLCAVPLLALYMVPEWFGRSSLAAPLMLRFGVSFLLLSGFAALVEWNRDHVWNQLNDTDAALVNATNQLKILEGLVPVCSYCKMVRDDRGYWRQLETFLRKNTSAVVSSGLCPSCAQERGLADTGAFAVPQSMQALFSWRTASEKTKKRFVIYSTMVGLATLAAFTVRDYALGNIQEVVLQTIICVYLIGIIGAQLKNVRPQLMYWLAVTGLILILVQPYFDVGSEPSEMSWFFLFPLISTYMLGNRAALILIMGLLSFALAAFQGFLPTQMVVSVDAVLFFGMSYVLVSILALNMERLRKEYTVHLTQRLESLEEAYTSIRTLKGLVPVCKECKSVRTDKGFWTAFDSYINAHTDLRLSHGICEQCLKREAPDVYRELQKEGRLDS